MIYRENMMFLCVSVAGIHQILYGLIILKNALKRNILVQEQKDITATIASL
jgi:hypothetical protein